MSSIIERLDLLADSECISLTELEREIGASKGILTRARANNTDIQTRWISKICELYPFWSAEWILRGDGRMFREGVPLAKKGEPHAADSNISKDTPPDPEPIPTKPHIDDVAAIAGYRGGAADSVMWHTTVYKPVIVGMPEYDLTMRVSGDSMYPYLCSGDLIALREVRSSYFKPGEIYVVSTDEDAFVKRVFRSDEEGMAIRCESINPSFPPFDLPGDSVIRMYRVVGMQRVI